MLTTLNEKTSIPHSHASAQIVVVGGEADFDTLALCLQAIIANTNLDKIQIVVYLSGERKTRARQMSERFGSAIELEVRHYNSDRVSYLVADAARKLPAQMALVLLSCEAIVSEGWFSALQATAKSRDDIAVVISRQIKHRNDRSAWEVIPYANNNHDIDVALSPVDSIVLNPGFDERNGSIELSCFNLFCAAFSEQIIDKLQWQYLIGLEDRDWLFEVSNAIVKDNQMHIVYTPKAKIFHLSYFQ
ncbi:MAG: hypothetical protein ACRC2R_12135 [Xenococcaceae cyanobacterium]